MPAVAQPVKCLLVDDLEDNLLVLEALLRDDGIEILKAQSAREALELLLENDIALALLDVNMPEMDGFQLADAMRSNEKTRHVPIIFVTAAIPERVHEFRGYDAGAVDFLFKPIEPRILRHKAETFFQMHRHRQTIAATLRLNEQLMAVVGHDLRNPLNVVLMTADVLAKRSQEPETREMAKRLQTSGLRMQRMIDELFDLTRARLSGGIPIVRADMDLGEVATKIVAESEAAHPRRTISLKSDGDLQGFWDEGRLAQVLSNLTGNALRHGSVDVPVLVHVRGREKDAQLSVKNGGFIEPRLLPHIFDPFHTGTNRRAKSDGLGLGLYIVQQIVHAHGGTVTVESTERSGTEFIVSLPRR